MDLNKEIKLSDLFRRKAKEAGGGAAEKAEKPAKERKALFARKERAAKESKAPKEPKTRRPRAPAKAGPELPAIPLMRAFNLQPGDDARERPSRLGLAQVLAALLGLLLIGGLGSAYIFMNARAGDRRAQVEDLRAQLADLEVPAETPVTPGDTELLTEGQARTASLAGALQGRVAWDRILREVSLVLPDDLYLTQVGAATVPQTAGTAPAPSTTATPAAAPNTMTLAGAAGKQSLVALFLSRLETLPEFASVDLQSSAYQEEGDVYVFSITATIAPGGAS